MPLRWRCVTAPDRAGLPGYKAAGMALLTDHHFSWTPRLQDRRGGVALDAVRRCPSHKAAGMALLADRYSAAARSASSAARRARRACTRFGSFINCSYHASFGVAGTALVLRGVPALAHDRMIRAALSS